LRWGFLKLCACDGFELQFSQSEPST
jgi:hypothetical protein